MLETVLMWVIVGLIVGLLGTWVMPGPDPFGVLGTVVVGIGGAVHRGLLCAPWTRPPCCTSTSVAILVATLGAVVLMSAYRLYTRRLRVVVASTLCVDARAYRGNSHHDSDSTSTTAAVDQHGHGTPERLAVGAGQYQNRR